MQEVAEYTNPRAPGLLADSDQPCSSQGSDRRRHLGTGEKCGDIDEEQRRVCIVSDRAGRLGSVPAGPRSRPVAGAAEVGEEGSLIKRNGGMGRRQAERLVTCGGLRWESVSSPQGVVHDKG